MQRVVSLGEPPLFPPVSGFDKSAQKMEEISHPISADKMGEVC